MPISGFPVAVVANDNTTADNPLCLATTHYSEGKFMLRGTRIRETAVEFLYGKWIAVCK